MDSYPIPVGPAESTFEVKRSQFITCIDHTPGVSSATAFIDAVRTRYPDANHHCYAYVAGAPDDVYKIDQSDDGEPRGTAGKPMLNVLQHAGTGEITVVVVRYFGGIKLGAGGLVRAYTQCVSTALGALETRQFVRRTRVGVTLTYALLDRVEHWLASTAVDVIDKRFDANVHIVLDVPLNDVDSTRRQIQELGQGTIVWRSVDGGSNDDE